MSVLVALWLFLTPPVPGALNRHVSQSNIHTTICAPGWTAKIRPPLSVTGPLKRRLAKAQGVDPKDFELDHLVPLEVGGAPRSLKNLWLEPWGDAVAKDRLENTIRREVCAGTLTLHQGRAVFLGETRSRHLRAVRDGLAYREHLG
jgi:hypothetical protein